MKPLCRSLNLRWPLLLSVWAALLVPSVGCKPPGSDGDGEESSDSASSDPSDSDVSVDEQESHYPLIPGAKWEYTVVDVDGVELRTEKVEAVEDESAEDGQVQIILEDNEDEEGYRSRSTIARIGSAAYRVRKEILLDDKLEEEVEYDPGFVRFDEAWVKMDEGDSKKYSYERSSTQEPGKSETRAHNYEIEDTDVLVKVPAGEFRCVHVVRERLTGNAAGEKVEYWFAPGVGKVLERRVDSGREERLKSFTVPSASR